MVYHYRGGTDLVVSDRTTGLPKAGLPGTLWDAAVGGTQYPAAAIFDDNGGTGGQVISGPGGRLAFDMDETLGAPSVWLDLGANERWRIRSWEDSGPQQGTPVLVYEWDPAANAGAGAYVPITAERRVYKAIMPADTDAAFPPADAPVRSELIITRAGS